MSSANISKNFSISFKELMWFLLKDIIGDPNPELRVHPMYEKIKNNKHIHAFSIKKKEHTNSQDSIANLQQALAFENRVSLAISTATASNLTQLLHEAIDLRKEDQIELLLLNKADINSKDKNGLYPLDKCILFELNDSVKLLKNQKGYSIIENFKDRIQSVLLTLSDKNN